MLNFLIISTLVMVGCAIGIAVKIRFHWKQMHGDEKRKR